MPKLLIIAGQFEAKALAELVNAYRNKGYEAEGVLMVYDRNYMTADYQPSTQAESHGCKYACSFDREVIALAKQVKPDAVLCSREFSVRGPGMQKPNANVILRELKEIIAGPKVIFDAFGVDNLTHPDSIGIISASNAHPIAEIDRFIRRELGKSMPSARTMEREEVGEHVAALAAEQRAMFASVDNQFAFRRK